MSRLTTINHKVNASDRARTIIASSVAPSCSLWLGKAPRSCKRHRMQNIFSLIFFLKKIKSERKQKKKDILRRTVTQISRNFKSFSHSAHSLHPRLCVWERRGLTKAVHSIPPKWHLSMDRDTPVLSPNADGDSTSYSAFT